MTRFITPRLGAYSALAAAGFLAGLLLGRPELVVVALPFLIAVAAALMTAREPDLEIRIALGEERAMEGDLIPLRLDLKAAHGTGRLDLELKLPRGLRLEGGTEQLSVNLGAGEQRTIELGIRAGRWGGYVVGGLMIRGRDRFGFFVFELPVVKAMPLRVYPRGELLKAMLRPLQVQAHAGNEVSRLRGDGIEFADVRTFVPGDRVRHINWRASARRGELHVNQHHPERSADVILFLDTFAEVEGESGNTTLDLAVRAAATLATRYLAQRDRVGMIGFGGVLRWLGPGMGTLQLYRLLDSLLDTQIILSYAWKGIDVIPARTLPPKALIIGLTSLLDERAIGALLDVRARGFDVAIVEVDPLPFVVPLAGELGEVAHRLWILRREALRERFREMGIAVAIWREGMPLEAALEEVQGFRRHASRARA